MIKASGSLEGLGKKGRLGKLGRKLEKPRKTVPCLIAHIVMINHFTRKQITVSMPTDHRFMYFTGKSLLATFSSAIRFLHL